MLFESNNNYLDMIMGLEYLSNEKVNDTDELTKGFLKGNMFENEYLPYKNLTFLKPSLKTEREKELFDIMKYSFAMNDYNLYLDVHPDNMEILRRFKDASNKLDMLTKKYAEKYGPIYLDQTNYQTYKWLSSPWPWDREDGKYV